MIRPAHGIVTKTVHKTLGGGGEEREVGWGYGVVGLGMGGGLTLASFQNIEFLLTKLPQTQQVHLPRSPTTHFPCHCLQLSPLPSSQFVLIIVRILLGEFVWIWKKIGQFCVNTLL